MALLQARAVKVVQFTHHKQIEFQNKPIKQQHNQVEKHNCELKKHYHNFEVTTTGNTMYNIPVIH